MSLLGFLSTQCPAQLSQGALTFCEGGEAGCEWKGSLNHLEAMQNSSGYFSNELDDSLCLQTGQSDIDCCQDVLDFPFGTINSTSAFSTCDLQDLLERNFDFKDYDSKKLFIDQQRNHKLVPDDCSKDLLTNESYYEMPFSSSVGQQPCMQSVYQNGIFQQVDSSYIEDEVMKAFAHFDTTTLPHTPIIEGYVDDPLDDLDYDLSNFPAHDFVSHSLTPDLFDAVVFNDSTGLPLLHENSVFPTSQTFLDEATYNIDQSCISQSSLSQSTSSSSLSSLSSTSPQTFFLPYPSPSFPLPSSSPTSSNLMPLLSFNPSVSITPSSLSSSTSQPSSLVIRPERGQRKKEQNKTAALKYRQRKRLQQGDFVKECEDTEHRNAQLKIKVHEINKEISYLKNLMIEISAINSL